MKVRVSAEEFQTFIAAISNVFRGGASLKIYKDYIECVVAAEDSASIVACARIHILNEEDINLGAGEEYIINVPDLSKFNKLLAMNDKDTFEFEIKGNYVYFKSDRVHGAKFVLDEIPPQKIDRRYNSKWFASFTNRYVTELSKKQMKDLLQVSSFADASDKIYFYQSEGNLIAECNDRTLDNIDNISIVLSTDGIGTIEDKIIISTDTLSRLILTTPSINFAVVKIGNAKVTYEALLITIEHQGVYVKYFLNTKKQ